MSCVLDDLITLMPVRIDVMTSLGDRREREARHHRSDGELAHDRYQQAQACGP
jgi:hypothetical protein